MKKRHKQYITEWKSINDSIKKVAETIINFMWYNSETKTPMEDRVVKVPFISGEFKFHFNTMLGTENNEFGIDSILVRYKLFFFDDAEQYNRNYDKIGNSEYNEDTRTLTINSALIDGDLDTTVTQEVYHELNHAFEYSNGMEKRISLYDAATNLVSSSNIIESSMGKIIYYTFPHEQDAFAHQFYGLLSRNKIKGDFDELVGQYLANYIDFENAIRIYKINFKNHKEAIISVLDKIGMTIEQFNKRLHFGKKRFYNKLKRVYQRHMYEMKDNGLTMEQHLKKIQAEQLFLMEDRKRYKNIQYDNSEYWW